MKPSEKNIKAFVAKFEELQSKLSIGLIVRKREVERVLRSETLSQKYTNEFFRELAEDAVYEEMKMILEKEYNEIKIMRQVKAALKD